MSLWLTLPWLLPLLTASLLLAFPRPKLRSPLVALTAVGMLFSSWWLWDDVQRHGVQVFLGGNWAAPFGIVLVGDRLASLLLLVVNPVAALGFLLFFQSQPLKPQISTPVLLCLWSAINGSLLAGDLFNLYVWFEISLICSMLLLSLPGTRLALNSALRYMVFSLVASLCLLTAIGLLYGRYGTLNLANLASKVAQAPDPVLNLIGCLFLVALAIKGALFPWGVWLPECYTNLPASYALFFGALLTKVSFYAWLRLLSLAFAPSAGDLLLILQVAACFTLVYGVLGSLCQTELSSILPFWICTSLGTMALAVSLWTPAALAAACCYLCHDILVKGGLFCASTLLRPLTGSEQQSPQPKSFFQQMPWCSAMILLVLFSVVGFPPFSGFWAKVMVLRACLEAGQGWLLGLMLLGSGLTLLTAGRIWCLQILRVTPGWRVPTVWACWALSLYGLATLVVGALGAEWLLRQSILCAQDLLDSSAYIEAVLRVKP